MMTWFWKRRTEIVEDERECEHKWRDYSANGGDFVGLWTCRDCGEQKPMNNPKDEGYHSLHADLWDMREGK